jgi:hypothetical protein
MPGVDLAQRVAEENLLGFGRRDTMPEFRFPPVGRVPVEPLEPANHQPHEERVAER